ncbi:MAG: homocysteine S-methyltransferase family protein [Acidobacteriia bacterium]|nr:homocysteine S-methyltransferase family protein [Terriglobia bacterium]
MPWNDWIKQAPLLADGAWGTELQKRGLPPGADPDGWNLAHPERVREVAESYVQAGSRVILTNTFRANPVSLALNGLAEQTAAINRAGVRISREAAGTRALVFASIGPTGKMLVTKEITEQQMKDAFAAQARALAEEGPDALLLETLTDLTEARIAAEAALAAGLPVIVSMVFDSGKNRDRTIMGTTPEQAAEALVSAGVQAIGANCGSGIRGYIAICRRLCAATTLPVWIKPNAGMPEMIGGKAIYRTTPEEFAADAREMAAAGAVFIGGCCGTSPDFIRAMAASGVYKLL